jgi:signal transduction histidine kinase/ActR/RegA family two-component response regulator
MKHAVRFLQSQAGGPFAVQGRRFPSLRVGGDTDLQRTLENLPAAAYTCDAAGTITFFNPKAAELWGREPRLNDPADRFCGSFKLYASDGTPIPHEQCWMALTLRDGVRYAGREIIIERPDGSRCIALAHVNPLFDGDGKVVGAMNVLVDITERKQLEQLLREVDRRKTNFLATLSHELRNPLSSIRNAVEVMRLKGSVEPEVEWCRDVIDRQIAQLARLVDDLHDMSRISRNRLELRKEPILLSEVIERAVETSRPLVEQCGHELILTVPSEPLYLHADDVRLSQVFTNLLNNAAKYTPPPGHIWLMSLEVEDEVVVSVRDDGIGIDPEQLASLFEMFYQVDGSEEHARGGLGIGLSLVRRLVEMHGGNVTARSDGKGRGSEFEVRLPLIRMPRIDAKPDDAESASRSSLGQRILIVDDDHDAAGSLARLMRMAGYETQIAYDGVEAIEVAELFRPAIVLLDIGLPKFDGHETCRLIREQPWGAEMVFIALTGWGQEDERRKSEEAGFAHHLVKPVEYQDLLALLDKVALRDSAAA